ncbi:N-terminal acetyltransferase A, auxiliary subunit [Trema orientale]|uniref:N-terminal acetyltransferase A, auxiliary subunit n=1 Tax=Trema orientale TaxID=63057 RepID=A0A2P5FNB8_TREOI|nr:N-terminal acetyltransferase A, auxiliary subunit [Trema orientale]
MVRIEAEETEEQVSNPSKPSSSPPPSSQKNADEGFETASDGELGDSDDDHHHPHQSQSDQQDEQIVSPNDHDDHLNQKALEQANDAKLEGNKLYSSGQFEDALSQYELALELAPEIPSSVEIRSTCHSNRAICYLKLGKYEDTIKECTKALELNPAYLKALLRRGEAHEKLEHFEEAIADMKKILELDPSNDQARKSIRRLEPLAAEKREKMKEEMIGKLKEMGNSLLGRFGMSVDNFKAVKDPNTGSYSISFQR